MSEELKKIGDRMVSAIIVANPAPHILWGTDELKIFIGCEDAKLRGYMTSFRHHKPLHRNAPLCF